MANVLSAMPETDIVCDRKFRCCGRFLQNYKKMPQLHRGLLLTKVIRHICGPADAGLLSFL